MDAAHLLLINAAFCVLAGLFLWRLSIPIRDPSFIDAWWPAGMAGVAWLSLALAGAPSPHAWALAIIVSIWALRLGGYLFRRWRAHGADRRYENLIANAKRERGWGYAKTTLIFVFGMQAALQFIVALPVQLGMIEARAALGPLAFAGVALALAGVTIETIADAQLARFKAEPANAGQVMDRGLWRYSRHPNHFGDACVWWGLYLIAAETGLGAWALPGPLLLTFLLLRISGAPTLEPHLARTRPGYADYVRRTSPFVLWPPKRA